MQLTYRGVNYDYTPNAIPKWGPVFATGVYRGAKVAFQTLADIPEQPGFDLTWRGVPYRSGSKPQKAPAAVHAVDPEGGSTASAAKAETTTSRLDVLGKARALFIRRHQKMRQREQSMLARLDEEVGLTADDAAHYESQIQGKMPHDFAGYDRSNAAMS